MKLLLSAMALFVSFSANSAVFNLGTLTPLHLQPFSVDFTGGVSDTYNFNVATPFAFTSSVVAGGTGVNNLTTILTSDSFTSIGVPSMVLGGTAYQSTIVESFLAVGNYSFNVFVATTAPTTGEYLGNFTVASPSVAAIPEPETYAMFLAGLGLLGFAARRRKQS